MALAANSTTYTDSSGEDPAAPSHADHLEGYRLKNEVPSFVPVTDAITFVEGRRMGDESEVALVNRSYLKGVEQVDRRTFESVKPLPGRPLGGTSYGNR